VVSFASQAKDPLKIDKKIAEQRMEDRKIKELKFYHSGIHQSLFALPIYLEKGLKNGLILTEDKPFVWEM
jgi:spermidine synthase